MSDEPESSIVEMSGRPEWSEFMTLYELPSPAPAQLRRTAELVELFYGLAVARPWWDKAAEAGDSDAQAMVELLNEEQE